MILHVVRMPMCSCSAACGQPDRAMECVTCLKIRDRYLCQNVFCFDVAAHEMSEWRDEYGIKMRGTVVARETQTCRLSG